MKKTIRFEKTKYVSVKLPQNLVDAVNNLVKKGKYESFEGFISEKARQEVMENLGDYHIPKSIVERITKGRKRGKKG